MKKTALVLVIGGAIVAINVLWSASRGQSHWLITVIRISLAIGILIYGVRLYRSE